MLEIQGPRTLSTASEYLMELVGVLDQVPRDAVERAVEVLLQAGARGSRVYVMGNGGSASTASHFVCDLVKTAYVPPHPPIRAHALSDNTPLLTAWANDSSYASAFSEQIDAQVERDDVVIAISASGNSPNIVNGLAAAMSRGARTIALVGFDGGQASRLADVVVHVPADHYGLVEDSHSAIGHAIASAIRRSLLGENGV